MYKKGRRGVDVGAWTKRNRKVKSPAFEARNHGEPADGMPSAATVLRPSFSEAH